MMTVSIPHLHAPSCWMPIDPDLELAVLALEDDAVILMGLRVDDFAQV